MTLRTDAGERLIAEKRVRVREPTGWAVTICSSMTASRICRLRSPKGSAMMRSVQKT